MGDKRCLTRRESEQMGKLAKVLLVLNLCLWIYFWVSFAHASHSYDANRLGHPTGTGYTIWKHSIGLNESGLVYPFFRITFYVEFPSLVLAVLAARAFDPRQISPSFFLGISEGGWILILAMSLSFLQWYVVGWVLEKIWRRCVNHPTAAPNQAAAAPPETTR